MPRNNLIMILGLIAGALFIVIIALQTIILSNGPSNGVDSTIINPQHGEGVVASADAEAVAVIQAPALPTPLPTPLPIATLALSPTSTIPPTTAPTLPQLPTVAASNIASALGEEWLSSAENLALSSNVDMLMSIIKNDPFAIGFMDHASYYRQRTGLRMVRIQLEDGRVVAPMADAVDERTYPFSRPLFVYTSLNTVQNKPEVVDFLGCFLSQIRETILENGFFPPRSDVFSETIQTYNTLLGKREVEALPVCDVSGQGGNIVVGSTDTMAHLTQRMVDLFIQNGYTGTIRTDTTTGTGSFEQLCNTATADLVSVDRQIRSDELARCQTIRREPIALVIAEDALSVVVSEQNIYVNTVTLEQLRLLFSTARSWSDVNPGWPDAPIVRSIPNRQHNAFIAFASYLFEGAENPVVTLARLAPPTATPPPTLLPSATPTSTPSPTATPTLTSSPSATASPIPSPSGTPTPLTIVQDATDTITPIVSSPTPQDEVAASIETPLPPADSVDPNLAFLAIFSRDCRDFGVIYSDFGYRKQPISYLKIAQI
ncbi:substrate-binding domain-containing protein [Chloroflexi bacterium TSY]|nr:substrate-binding domain-containing protein [Chloroflexi bacterium TSY]